MKKWKKIARLGCTHHRIGSTDFDGPGDWNCNIYQILKQ
jgi:hypothetical protein